MFSGNQGLSGETLSTECISSGHSKRTPAIRPEVRIPSSRQMEVCYENPCYRFDAVHVRHRRRRQPLKRARRAPRSRPSCNKPGLGSIHLRRRRLPRPIAQASSLSSQQVQAQLAEAKTAGVVTFGNLDYPPVAQSHASTLSRAEVQNELACQDGRPGDLRQPGLPAPGQLIQPPRVGPSLTGPAQAQRSPSAARRKGFVDLMSDFVETTLHIAVTEFCALQIDSPRHSMRPSQPAPYPQETPHVHRHQTRPVAGRRKIGFAIALMLERSGDYSVLVADQDPAPRRRGRTGL